MAQVNRPHPGPMLIGIQAARFPDHNRRARPAASGSVLPAACRAAVAGWSRRLHAQSLTWLRPERRGVVHIVGIGARVGRSAEAARIEFMDACAAFTALARLAVHLAANSAAFAVGQLAASRVHAYPQARQAPKKIMDAARKQPGALGVDRAPCCREPLARSRRDPPEVRCVRKQFTAQFFYRPRLLHCVVDEKSEWRKFHERLIQASLKVQARWDVPMVKKRADAAVRAILVCLGVVKRRQGRCRRAPRHRVSCPAPRGASRHSRPASARRFRPGRPASCAPKCGAYAASLKLAVAQMT